MFKCEFIRNILFGDPCDVKRRTKVGGQDNVADVSHL